MCKIHPCKIRGDRIVVLYQLMKYVLSIEPVVVVHYRSEIIVHR